METQNKVGVSTSIGKRIVQGDICLLNLETEIKRETGLNLTCKALTQYFNSGKPNKRALQVYKNFKGERCMEFAPIKAKVFILTNQLNNGRRIPGLGWLTSAFDSDAITQEQFDIMNRAMKINTVNNYIVAMEMIDEYKDSIS